MNMRQVFDLAWTFLFASACLLIGWVSITHPTPMDKLVHEARPLTPFPPLQNIDDWKRFPERFEAYFEDRLVCRESLLNWHATIKVRGLGVSSSPKVILGEDGWLFFDASQEPHRVVSDSPIAQAQLWLESLQNWQKWCERRQIHYVVVLIPEKQSVYEEKLPPAHRPPQPKSAVDLFREIAPQQLGESYLDLLPELRKTKTIRPLYFRTDTHWNDDGAFVGYDALARRLGLDPMANTNLIEETVTGFEGDLARMLHLPQPLTETIRLWRLRTPRAARQSLEVPLDSRLHSPRTLAPQVWSTKDANKPRGVLFHDSFAVRLWLPLLAEHFDELVYAPAMAPDPQIIDRFRPAVVIHQMVERRINFHIPVSPR